MELNRLRWAVRRGMLELDLILGPFLENVFPNLPANEQALFEKLLSCEDQDLFYWFINKADPLEPQLRAIVNIIRDHTGLQSNA